MIEIIGDFFAMVLVAVLMLLSIVGLLYSVLFLARYAVEIIPEIFDAVKEFRGRKDEG